MSEADKTEKSEQLVSKTEQPIASVGMTRSFLTSLKDYKWAGPDGVLYTPQQVEIFLRKTELGIARDIAIRCAGLEDCVVDFWIEEGKKNTNHYRDFKIYYNRIVAEAESTMLESIQRTGDFQFQAALAYLKLMNPEKYGASQTNKEDNSEPVRVVVLKDGFEEP